MSDILSTDRLWLFFLFFLPGFISVKVWSLIVPSERVVLSDRAIEVLSFGCVNFALMSWLVAITLRTETAWQYVYLAVVLFIAPTAWPILLRGILGLRPIRDRVIHPTPKAWDAFFGRREICFVLVHLTNGNIVGGLYAGDSFASSFPHDEDIYLEEVWYVDESGKFQAEIPGTKGMLITRDAFEYLELFEVPLE